MDISIAYDRRTDITRLKCNITSVMSALGFLISHQSHIVTSMINPTFKYLRNYFIAQAKIWTTAPDNSESRSHAIKPKTVSIIKHVSGLIFHLTTTGVSITFLKSMNPQTTCNCEKIYEIINTCVVHCCNFTYFGACLPESINCEDECCVNKSNQNEPIARW